ncbi:hypothetical protein BGZ83_006642 [Gryganskiella cystojenkinii]|nr:hypothetical protein BGZ83_006642 [Gryganskiella cystojenkinii]
MESKLSWILKQAAFVKEFNYDRNKGDCDPAKKALSNAQTALIGTAGNLLPGTLDQVGNAKGK